MNAMPRILSLLTIATANIWTMNTPPLVDIHPAPSSQVYTQEQNELIEKLISQTLVLQHNKEIKDNIRKRIIRLLPIYLSRRTAHDITDFVQQYGQQELATLINEIYHQAFKDYYNEETLKWVLEMPS